MAGTEGDPAKREGTEAADSSPTEGSAGEDRSRRPRPWLVVVGAALLLAAGAAGFGIGYATRGGSDGPDLSEQEAYEQARESAEREVTREMARLGYEEGKRSGHRHGLVAGGMAAESDASVIVRERWAGEAQAAAASAQAELAGISAAPPPPTPDVPDE